MKLFITLLIICLCWIVLAQSCMRFRTSDSDAQLDFAKHNVPFKAEYFKTGNTTIHYIVSGSDSTLPTLFFIHGSPGSWDAFDKYLQDSQLLKHYRMISIDRPGFGYSEFGNAQNLDDQAAEITKVLEHIQNGKPICLIGHSLGGPMVVKLASLNTTLPITNLVILAGSVDPAEEKPESWRVPLDRTPLRFLVPGAMRPSNAELLMFKQDVQEMPADLSKVTCRVLIMHGTVDDFVPPGNALYAQKHLTHAKDVQVVWFEGQRHFIPWEKFTDIRDALLQLNMNP